MSENLFNRLVTRGVLDSVRREDFADYGPFDHDCQGKRHSIW